MKLVLFILISVILPLSLAMAQDHDISCKAPASPVDSRVSDVFVEGYVNAFGFPQAGGYTGRLHYLQGLLADKKITAQKATDIQAQIADTEKRSAEFLALDIPTQHRLYVEGLIQLRIGYLGAYLQKQNCPLTEVDVFAISIYTGPQYEILKHALKSGNPDELRKYQFLIDAINTGLSKINPYEGMTRTGVNENDRDDYQLGKVFTHKSFLSSTLGAAYHNRPYQLMIKSKTGAYIAPISSAPMEEEVLFKSGTAFRVLGFENGGHVINVEEVPPEEK